MFIKELGCSTKPHVVLHPICYLALVIDNTSYNAIPGATRFVRPVDPGIFTPTAPLGVRAVPLTPADIATQKIAYDEEKEYTKSVK